MVKFPKLSPKVQEQGKDAVFTTATQHYTGSCSLIN